MWGNDQNQNQNQNQYQSRFLSRLSGMEGTTRSDYVTPFKGVTQIKDCKLGHNRNGREFVAVEFIILSSDTPSTHVGDIRTWMMMTDKDPTGPSLISFFQILLDIRRNQLTDPMIKSFLTDKPSPLIGMPVRIHARNKVLTNGSDFTILDFHNLKTLPDIVGLLDFCPPLKTREEVLSQFNSAVPF